MLLLAQIDTDNARGECIAEHRSVQPGGKVVVGVRVALAPGWHIYWHNSGDSGMPTRIEWTAPEGVTVRTLPWPAPERVPEGPLVMYGYEHEVLFAVELAVPRDFAGKSLKIRAKADWLVCADVCEEGGVDQSIELPVSKAEPEADARWSAAFKALRAAQPTAPPAGALAAPSAAALRLDADRLGVKSTTEAYFFPRETGIVAYAKPQVLRWEKKAAILAFPPPETAKKDRIERLVGVLVLRDGKARRAFAVDVPVTPPQTERSKEEK